MASVPRRVDFSSNSKIYDNRHGAVISDRLAKALAGRLRLSSTIIDIGAGTGRVAIALAGNGFKVVAVDPAFAMLQTMRGKSADARLMAVGAEATRLPLRRRCADAVVLARLLYLVSDWQGLLREAKAVLRQGGTLFHEWGNGEASEAWVQVREKLDHCSKRRASKLLFIPERDPKLRLTAASVNSAFVELVRLKQGLVPRLRWLTS
jgi:ubiquinone/menaquinone biosynthesis C-methylase UbiE